MKIGGRKLGSKTASGGEKKTTKERKTERINFPRFSYKEKKKSTNPQRGQKPPRKAQEGRYGALLSFRTGKRGGLGKL